MARKSRAKSNRTRTCTATRRSVEEYNKLNVSDQPPLHENFREYSVQELIEIKKANCIAHQCPYLSKINWTSRAKSAHPVSNLQITCNYILVTGHCRDCMPDVCRHWKDKSVEVQKITNSNLFDNHVDFE